MKTFLLKSSARWSGLPNGQRAAVQYGVFFLVIGLLFSGCPVSEDPATKPGNTVNKTQLETAITDAETNIGSVPVAADASEVLTTAQWVSAEDQAAYQNAIDAAKAVFAAEAATQAQVGAAVTALAAATTTFNGKKQNGSATEAPVVDKTALDTAIDAAEVNIGSVSVAAAASDVLNTAQWVLAADKTAYQTAITAAQAVYDNANATQTQVTNAITALDAATTIFNGKKQQGTATDVAGVNRSALTTAITSAETAIGAITVAANGDAILPTAQWILQADKTTYQHAIDAARAVNSATASTQAQVDGAVSTLATATGAFNTAKKTGNTANITNLTQAIDAAVSNLATAEPSNDGTDIMVDEYWVSEEIYTEYEDAISAAQAVQTAATTDINTVTVKQVSDALAALTAKQTAFNEAKALGSSTANKTALNTAISTATTALGNTSVSTDGYDVLTTAYWVSDESLKTTLQSAITAAQAVANDAGAEQTEVNAAKDALDGAITTFTNARNAGKKVPGSVTYTFSGLPVDETITLSAASALSWTNNTSLTVSVSETFNAYEWYIDGVVVSGQTTQSITLQARTYRVGVHTLTLRVQKDGVWYTKTLTFTVS